jgi:hypothetical protein
MRLSSRSASLVVFAFAPVFLAVACGVDESGSADPIAEESEAGAGADGASLPNEASSDGGTEGSSDGGGDGPSEASGPCGADAGTSCAVGAACTADADCEGTCTAKVCAAPTHTDGKVSPSLGETDIDCGGATAPKCLDDATCKADGDCTSTACSVGKKCVAPSCKGSANGTAGLETCGAGEAATESCCRSLPLPARPTRRLDKYEITAGRLRAFIDAVTAANAGVPNVRAFAIAYAAAHPGSQLADVVANYPGLIDVLPDHAGPSGAVPLPYHLGAVPLDPINSLDGCYVGPDAYGHATYWQPPADLAPLGVGYPDVNGKADGVRKISRAELDKKAMNCVMPIMLSAFCAWDGGELARTEDFHEIWGRNGVTVPTPNGQTTVYIPWSAALSIGEWNYRNGHGAACNPIFDGCTNPQLNFYAFPLPHDPANDDSAAIGAPGRFPKDVTKITSASGEGWFDVGGNMMEAAWPVGAVNVGNNPVTDVCDTGSGTPGPGETACARRGKPGVLRFSGSLPHIALVGYSFEAHQRRSEAYLASLDGKETRISAGDLKPITFQYGKVGGRCAR